MSETAELAPISTEAPSLPADEPKVEPEQLEGDELKADDEAEAKPRKSPEQKALEKANKRIDTIWAQRQEARERIRQLEQQLNVVHKPEVDGINQPEAEDSGKLSLSRAELQQMIEREAKRLAPQIKEQSEVVEQRSKAARALQQELGPERWEQLTEDMADLLPPDAQLLVLETDAPRALLEYLTDPEHEAEAKAIARLSPSQQGLKIGLLAEKLRARRNRDKPIASEAARPLEPMKGQGSATPKPLALLSDKEFAERRRAHILSRRG